MDGKRAPRGVRPSQVHDWIRIHALLCDGAVEPFAWVYDGGRRAWADKIGIRWCPEALAEMGWTYVRPLQSHGPKTGGVFGKPLASVVVRDQVHRDTLAKPLGNTDHAAISKAINSLVSQGISPADREDICQDALILALERGASINDLPNIVKEVRGRHSRMYDTWKPQAVSYAEWYEEALVKEDVGDEW